MKANKKLLIPILLAIFTISVSFSINTASAAVQPTIYVDFNGNDAWSGESSAWNGTDGPKKTIKSAIGTVSADGTVKISNGTYKESNIIISKNLKIQGDNKYNTIIDAQYQNRIFTIVSGVKVDISNLKLTNGKTSNCGGAISSKGSLSITNCDFTNNKAPNYYGGAIYNEGYLTIKDTAFLSNSARVSGAVENNKGNLIVDKCYFKSNKATNGQGGSIVNAQGSLNVKNTVFSYNSATNGYGGVFYNTKGSLGVTNCTFYYNTGPQGGAIYTEDSVGWIYLTNNVFVNNRATRGAALYHCHGTIVVTNNTFTSNIATVNGGAIYIDSTGLSSVSKSMIYFKKCSFTSNQATTRHGGAIYSGGAFEAKECKFNSNSANYGAGGAICNAQGLFSVVSNTFTYNKATKGKGGALYSNYGRIYVISNTFYRNSGASSSGYSGKGIYLWKTTATFKSNRFI